MAPWPWTAVSELQVEVLLLLAVAALLVLWAIAGASRSVINAVFGRTSSAGRGPRSAHIREMDAIEDEWSEDARVVLVAPTGDATDCVVVEDRHDHTTVVVVVPGNPGNPHFYHPFARRLHELAGCGVHVVGHLGHSTLAKGLSDGVDGVDLEGQISHKFRYVQMLLRERPHVRLALVGHSIGAHIILEVVNRLPRWRRERIIGVFGLFPTIMEIGATPNGLATSVVFRLIPRHIVSLVAGVLGMLPRRVQQALLRMHLGSEHPNTVRAAMHLLDRQVVLNCLYMAGDEMEKVRDLEYHRSVLSRCGRDGGVPALMYFGLDDRWCPREYAHFIAERFPNVAAVWDDAGMRHAFVIGGAHAMAEKLARWLHIAAEEEGGEDGEFC